MKVDFKGGMFSITAETKQENEQLFELINGGSLPKLEKVETTEKRTYKKRRRASECPVEGCDKMVKNPSIHMLQKHGIDKEGNVQDTFIHNISGKMPVSAPVVKLPNGTYKLQKKAGLLA